jgi:hypothetical protein
MAVYHLGPFPTDPAVTSAITTVCALPGSPCELLTHANCPDQSAARDLPTLQSASPRDQSAWVSCRHFGTACPQDVLTPTTHPHSPCGSWSSMPVLNVLQGCRPVSMRCLQSLTWNNRLPRSLQGGADNDAIPQIPLRDHFRWKGQVAGCRHGSDRYTEIMEVPVYSSSL